MDARAAAERWASTWCRAWEAGDPDAICALYRDDAVHSVDPFRDPSRGLGEIRAYLERILPVEVEVRATFSAPIVDGELAAVSWWASMIEEGHEITLAGTSVLRFDADGLVAEEWDAYNLAEERREPAYWWHRP